MKKVNMNEIIKQFNNIFKGISNYICKGLIMDMDKVVKQFDDILNDINKIKDEINNMHKRIDNIELDLNSLKSNKMRKIEVNYNGEYPKACKGYLIIKVNDIEIYNKKDCCKSTGSTLIDANWHSYINHGNLKWRDANNFDEEIRKEVQKELDKVAVCCGGCLL